MVQIAATRAALIKPEWQHKVPSPAYDSMTPAERNTIRQANPWSFLNVTLSPEDIEDYEVIGNEALTQMAQQALEKIKSASAYTQTTDCIYLYQLQTTSHKQTAVVVELNLSEYESGTIKIHEQVREDRAQLLADHLIKLKVTSSPIACMYQNDDTLDQLISAGTAQPPTITIEGNKHQVKQIIWHITDSRTIVNYKNAFASKDLYIIDGHHRAAASLAARKQLSDTTDGHIFGALFSQSELQLLGFNRWIKPSSNPRPVTTAVETLITSFGATTIDHYIAPSRGESVLYLPGQWLNLPLKPSAETDAAALQEQLIQPYFNIEKPDDQRITNLPGDQAFERLQRLVDTNGGVGIFIAPLAISEFIDTADAGKLLPPKSTYFTPKVQSGVFLRDSNY